MSFITDAVGSINCSKNSVLDLRHLFLLFTWAVPRIYPHAPPLSQALGAWKKSEINLGIHYHDSGVVRGVTRWAGGAHFPGAELLRGSRKVATMSQVLSSIQ